MQTVSFSTSAILEPHQRSRLSRAPKNQSRQRAAPRKNHVPFFSYAYAAAGPSRARSADLRRPRIFPGPPRPCPTPNVYGEFFESISAARRSGVQPATMKAGPPSHQSRGAAAAYLPEAAARARASGRAGGRPGAAARERRPLSPASVGPVAEPNISACDASYTSLKHGRQQPHYVDSSGPARDLT